MVSTSDVWWHFHRVLPSVPLPESYSSQVRVHLSYGEDGRYGELMVPLHDTQMKEAWYLDGYLDGESHPRRIDIHTSPFRIGRSSRTDVHCVLPCKSLSAVHAEIRLIGGGLWICDSKSSNGTFVNRKRINGPIRVQDGDVIHFATSEFLVMRAGEAPDEAGDDLDRTQLKPVSVTQLPRRTVSGLASFREILSTAAVSAVFQPIMSRAAGAATHVELLGRGTHPGLPAAPYELFRIAAALDSEAQLSRLFEQVGFRDAAALPAGTGIFINLHPAELEDPQFDALVDFLATQRAAAPDQKMVVEIHESAVLVRAQMMRLSARLNDLGIELAYDDFGAGQARLLELIDVPCNYLKFDRSMITDIDKASPTRQTLLESLVRMVSGLGIASIAEGVETRAEWRVCREMGFTHGQGYYFGKPAPVSHWTEERLARIARSLL